jgi:hypothetical protein
MVDAYLTAHRGLVEADLESKTEWVGHRLLVLADENSGQVNLSWDEYLELCGCNNVGSARRHLTRLAAADLIHYSTSAHVYVTWMAWMTARTRPQGRVDAPGTARGRAEVDGDEAGARWGQRVDAQGEEGARRGQRVDAQGEEEDAPGAARGRAGVRVDAPGAARGRAETGSVLLVSQLVDPEERTNYLTNCDAVNGDREWQRRLALLTDPEVGLDRGIAAELARRHPFETLLRQVMSWRRDVAVGRVRGSGALVHRIQNGFGASVLEEDRSTLLYRRHVTEETEEEARLRAYVPEEYADIIVR